MLAPENRSKLMSLIRGRGNRTTELRLVELMRAAGLKGWRRHLLLPGKPDFTFRPQKVCVFVHGCFWHGCPHCYRQPRTNSTFWIEKVTRNQARDRRVARKLRADGYRVVTAWECDLSTARAARTLQRIARALGQRQSPARTL